MLSSRLLTAPLVVALMLAGCASVPPSRQALNPALQSQIGSTEVIVGLPQSLLFVQQPAKPAPTTDPQAEVLPLRAALNAYRFDQQLRLALDKNLRKLPRLATRPVQLQPQASEAIGAARLQSSSADAVLLITASYSMAPDYSRLDIGLRATLVPRSVALRNAAGLKPKLPKELDLSQALYRNTIVFRSQLPGAGPDPLSNRSQWLVDQAYPLHQALDDGLVEVVAALIEDLRVKPGVNSIGPALTDGYQRQRAPDGTLSISGLASAGRSVQVEGVAEEQTLAAPTAIEAPPPVPEEEMTSEMVEPGLVVPLPAEPDSPASEAPPAEPKPATTPESAQAVPAPADPVAESVPTTPAPHLNLRLPPPSPTPMATTPPRLSLSPELASPPAPPVTVAPAATAAAPAAPRPARAPIIAPPAVQVAPTPAAASSDQGITLTATPLRIRPTSISAASSTLPPGTDIKLLGRTRNTTGEWLYVQGPNDSGWARSEEVQLVP